MNAQADDERMHGRASGSMDRSVKGADPGHAVDDTSALNGTLHKQHL